MQYLYEDVELYDYDLEDYQHMAVDFLKQRKKAALFLDTGLGKTAISLRVIRDLIDSGDIENVLIIAPLKPANQTWPNEIRKWEFSAPIPHKQIRADWIVKQSNAIGDAAKKRPLVDKDWKKIKRAANKDLRKFEERNPNSSESVLYAYYEDLLKIHEKGYREHLRDTAKYVEANRLIAIDNKENPAIIHIINKENVEWLVESCEDSWIYDCIIFDESDALKDDKTKRWKALNRINNKVKRFYQLTATPATESYLDLYAQIKLLDGGERLGYSKTKYIQEYFDVNKYNHKTTLRVGAEQEITKAISDIALVMKQEDYLKDVPNAKIENVYYDLPPDVRAMYNSLSETGYVALPCGKEIQALSAISVLQKLMQLSAGFIYDGEETINDFGNIVSNRKVYHVHDAKIEALRNLMARFPNDNFLISYYHKGSLELLRKHFPNAVSMDRKGTQQTDWNAGKIKMLLMHPQSGSHGLNLQYGGKIVINFDVFFSYTLFYQFWRRLARRGSDAEDVLVFNLIGKSTYDATVERECWRGKKTRHELFFDLLKKFNKFNKKKGKGV